MRIVNLAGYLFVSIPDPAAWRAPLRDRCDALQLRGTILLSPEGINLFIAGAQTDTDALLAYLRDDPLFEGRLTPLTVKVSHSDDQPFKRMLVKLKREIITMRHPTIRPEAGRAPSVSPEALRTWLDRGHDDDGRPVVLLDTRNGFEIDHGTFDGAIDWRLEKFGDFPDAVETHRDSFAGKTVVSFCTGGIRCEKAAIHMANTGISHVYQLEGGILGYFEHVGGEHYNGACFVFDEREALTPTLQPTAGPSAASEGKAGGTAEAVKPVKAADVSARPTATATATPSSYATSATGAADH